MYYIFVENDKINGCGECYCESEGITCIEVSEEVYNAYANDHDLYIYDNGEIVENPDYEEIKQQKEKKRIGNLTMTKRVFALGLQQYGITYSQLKDLIATNEQAQLEWDLCVELERKNPLLDVMAAQMGITSEQLDNMFKLANGETP
jgi:hypothetical protein